MNRFPVAIITAGLTLATATAAVAQSGEVHQSKYHDYRVVTVADGFEIPWGMTFLPGGEMLVTERPGRIRIVRNGRLVPTPVRGAPEVLAQGQGGMLDIVAHPEFSANRLVYLSYSKPRSGGEGATTAIARARYENGALHDFEDIFIANSEGRGHYGSRIVFDGRGHIFFSVGDRQAPPRGDLAAHPAQDRSTHHGTINRIYEDGRIPEDNPFMGVAGVEPSIYSFGHRNPQGMVMNMETGELWATEHGPQGGDELNLILPGENYGWPVVGYGVNYGSGSAIHEGTMREGWQNPSFVWVPSIGTSGLELYTGNRFPEWQGDLFAGGLSGEVLYRLRMDGDVVVDHETLLTGVGRIRDVRQGPDGYLYVALERRDGEPSRLIRLEPAG
ncbi:MAG: PQQ-dependent sugar dehydrogenase [Longimicrobiales bacterium]|nr:PQQ-dependent sugar dehydrogenase [Longimicrobiales bacterium]